MVFDDEPVSEVDILLRKRQTVAGTATGPLTQSAVPALLMVGLVRAFQIWTVSASGGAPILMQGILAGLHDSAACVTLHSRST
jgi:hypothetical protein